jgi:hypothetical protein
MNAIMILFVLAASLVNRNAAAGESVSTAATNSCHQPDFWSFFMSAFAPVLPIAILVLLLLYTKTGRNALAAALTSCLSRSKDDSKR